MIIVFLHNLHSPGTHEVCSKQHLGWRCSNAKSVRFAGTDVN